MSNNMLNGDALVIKKWVVTSLLTLGLAIIAQTMTAVWWASEVDTRLDAREDWRIEFKSDMQELKLNSGTALNVLRDHGVEFQEMRNRIILAEQRVEGMRIEMLDRTRDRFKKDEWFSEKDALHTAREQDLKYYDQRMADLARRIEQLEK